ncbi:transposase-like protein [Metarhizium guizhouense ARSEF 977]|uniref:Transposase-like protein n=1 Tax=Metarhizium guizhouense (strain ARSEF 977) TaxID=1276136 RepID=A0A0B4GHI4_METGA|nr:transposase-like protein [Metarhizium guizhouense ARSEF 977]KID81933.1 transposase-like protein [Metarhizium guizhouense ARSEF 977]
MKISDASASMGDSTCQMSEPDSSQLLDISWSGSPDSTATFASTPSGRGSKKRTQTATETWAHAKKLKLDEQVRRDRAGNRIWVCGKCPWESASLTSARNHLDLRHGVKIKAQQRQVVRKGQAKLEQIFQRQGQRSQAEADERERGMLSKAINQTAFDESLLQLIVNNNLPHRAVEYPELYSLIMSVNYMAADIYPKSRAAIPRKIEHAFLQEKDEIRQHLQGALSEIHLACDVWTTEHKKKAFLAVVAHFVDAGGKSRKALLGLPRLRGGHGGQHQAEHLNRIIDWYGIAHKLGYYIGDNHGSNDKCCRFISCHLREQYQVDWQPKTRRIRCHGHVINLASQAFIFAPDKETIDAVVDEVRRGSSAGRSGDETNVDDDRDEEDEREDEENRLVAVSRKKKRRSWKDIGPLGKLHMIVAHMRASELLYNEFLDAAGRMIPMDNDTRWNSWYTMGAVACELEGHVDAFVKAHRKEIGKYALTPDDWDTIREINTFLKPFEKVTSRTQGDLDCIEKTLATMDILVKHFEKQKNKHSNNIEFQNAILMAWHAFDKYYLLTDEVPAYAAALLLHPSRRKRYIDVNWNKAWVTAVLPKLQRLWEERYATAEADHISHSSEPTHEPDEYDILEQDLDVVQTSADNWASFIEADPTEISTKSALEWWCQKQQRARYPRLSLMAIDILSVPAMSAEAERVFSGARRQIPWSRANLGSRTVEQMECLKHWLKNGWLDQLNIALPGERGGQEVEGESGTRWGDSMASCASQGLEDALSDTSSW